MQIAASRRSGATVFDEVIRSENSRRNKIRQIICSSLQENYFSKSKFSLIREFCNESHPRGRRGGECFALNSQLYRRVSFEEH